MKKSKLLLTLLMTTLFVGFTSCDNDDDINMRVEKNEVNVEVGEKVAVKITEGNGDYTVVSTDEETATAILKDSEILISGLKEGTTTVTITDKEKKTATITVNVIGIAGTWQVNKDKLTIEVEANEEATEAIKADIANDNLKSLELNADKTFTLTREGEEGAESTVSGTYVYIDKILTLAVIDGEETETITLNVSEITKTTLKADYDQTELYQSKYPNGEVTKVLVTYELSVVTSQE